MYTIMGKLKVIENLGVVSGMSLLLSNSQSSGHCCTILFSGFSVPEVPVHAYTIIHLPHRADVHVLIPVLTISLSLS